MTALTLGPMRKVGGVGPYVRLDASGGLLSVGSAEGALLEGCWAGVELSDGRRYTTEGRSSVCEVSGAGASVRAAGDEGRPGLRWEVAPDEDGRALRLWVEVENTTG